MKKFILLLAVLGLGISAKAQVTIIDSGTCGAAGMYFLKVNNQVVKFIKE